MRKKRENKEIRLNVMGLPTFYGAFDAFKEQCAEYDEHWGEGTLELYESYLCGIIVPNLKDHNERPVHDYKKEEFELLLAEHQLRVKCDDETIRKYRGIIRTVITVAAINGLCGDLYGELEEVSSSKTPLCRAVPPRSMSAKQEIMVKRYLQEHLYESGEMVGLWLMYLCGLRNGEVCGADFGSIKELKHHRGIYVLELPETVKNGKSTLQIGGKTYSTARHLYLPSEVVQTLWHIRDKRIGQLQAKNKEIPDKLPIACSKSDPAKRCSATDLTRAARQMFIAVGMRSDEMNDLAKTLWMDQERAKHQINANEYMLIEKEPTAYLLRRHFATMLEILNLTESEKQYLMGHRIEDPAAQRSDFLDEELMWTMIEKLMRRPLLGSAQEEITVNGSLSGIFRDRQTILIPAGAGRLSVNIATLEPDTPIQIRIQRDAETEVGYGIGYQPKSDLPSQPMYIDSMIRKVYGNVLEESHVLACNLKKHNTMKNAVS